MFKRRFINFPKQPSYLLNVEVRWHVSKSPAYKGSCPTSFQALSRTNFILYIFIYHFSSNVTFPRLKINRLQEQQQYNGLEEKKKETKRTLKISVKYLQSFHHLFLFFREKYMDSNTAPWVSRVTVLSTVLQSLPI